MLLMDKGVLLPEYGGQGKDKSSDEMAERERGTDEPEEDGQKLSSCVTRDLRCACMPVCLHAYVPVCSCTCVPKP